MIKYYQRTIKDQRLRKLKSFQVGSLVHVANPKDEEIEALAKELKLDINIIKDALDHHEAPRMEIKKDITYVFARVPRHDSEIKHISTFPVMFAVGKDFLLILSTEETHFFLSALKRHKKYYTTQRTKLFIRFFFEIENLYNELLNKISKRINYFGLNVGVVKDQDIINFVRYEVILNEFISALLPVKHLLASIVSGKALDLHPYDNELIEDLQLNNDQIIERSKSNLANLVNIRQAQEVISTNRLNRIITVLTVSTVVLTLPTMITSFYGMNVNLPFADRGSAFLGITIFIFILIFGLLFILKRKRII